MKETRVIKIDPQRINANLIREAAAVLRAGGLVAFPTETVYGLGANALAAEAVAGIFVAKERPTYDPLIVHLAETQWLERVVRFVPALAWQLAERFWPGPLTLVLPRSPQLPLNVTAGGDTVAVRVPADPIAQALIRAADLPIAAPSANRFGRLSPTCAEDVLADLAGRIDLIIDAGSTRVGVESTVLSLVTPVPTILRPGGVSREALSMILGEVAVRAKPAEDGETAHSPGTLSQHYAPAARLILYHGQGTALLRALRQEAMRQHASGKRVGLFLAQEDLPFFSGLPLILRAAGPLARPELVAQALFPTLRALDSAGADLILARDFGIAGLGLAIRDRLTRAAGGKVICVE
ncbi:MAG: L-threonylcarbamoyladenylate synthase [Chloroflexota bacterium]|nr:L-threonylcarbamoyladenylate synthase [Chloroflexota bacterium]